PAMFDDEPGNGSPGEELYLLVELLRFVFHSVRMGIVRAELDMETES
ncbi:hypothetical protein Tco_1427066, partial [Tanacetum coccineum]